MDRVNFVCTVDIEDRNNQTPLLHFWEHTVGSGHATLALRADWQKQLTRCKNELGFKHVRFHGILSDDIGTFVIEQDKPIYSFYNGDVICDFLLSIGMRPFVELSFMPSVLASGNTTVFHYNGNITPPKDYAQWQQFIKKLVAHWVERYGIEEVKEWFFEVWNEPNLKSFWKGTQASYFKLYKYTVEGIKTVHPDLKVGGPATAKNAWIPEFISFCKKKKLSVDFISTHHYPTDAMGKPGDDTIEQLAHSKRSILHEQAALAKEQAGNLPLYYTEWSSSSNPFDELHDTSYAAAFIIKTVMEARNYVYGYSYWTFTDVFEENYFSSLPFHGGFGLMNIYGIPKPAYRAFELLHHLGDHLLSLAGTHTTIDAWITRKDSIIKILITNTALPRHEIKTEIITVQLNNIKEISMAYIERIDEEHCNPKKAWMDAGQPATLTKLQVEAIEAASELRKEYITPQCEKNSTYIEVSIPPQGIACITLELPQKNQ